MTSPQTPAVGRGGEAPTCEYIMRWRSERSDGGARVEFCGTPATKRYPAMGGGYMHLCDEHSIPHLNYAEDVPHVG